MKYRFSVKEEREYLVEVETEEKLGVAREMAQLGIMKLFATGLTADFIDDNLGKDLHLVASRALGSSARPSTERITNLRNWINFQPDLVEVPRCPECGNEEVQLSHNTLSFYCVDCDKWFEEKN